MLNYTLTIYMVVKLMVLTFAWALIPNAPDAFGLALVILLVATPVIAYLERHVARKRIDRVRTRHDRFDHYIADTTRTAL